MAVRCLIFFVNTLYVPSVMPHRGLFAVDIWKKIDVSV